MTALAADDVDRADVDDDRGTAGPARALGDERGCAGASGSHIGIDRQVERATRPGSCQRARGTAAKRAAAADRLHDDAIGLIARRVDSRADGRSEEPTSELQSLKRITDAVLCLKNKNNKSTRTL